MSKVRDWSRGGGKSLCNDLSLTQPFIESDATLRIDELLFPFLAGFFSVFQCTPNHKSNDELPETWHLTPELKKPTH